LSLELFPPLFLEDVLLLFLGFKARVSNITTIKKFLQLESRKKPPPDEEAVALIHRIFKICC
ncbi:GSTA2 transferase, partial [Alectura lathami]|nr:GSTA2 transferase [Alectura lathami]